ncbi:MAG: TldD/PmbA family protein [Parvibaculales bacterium]
MSKQLELADLLVQKALQRGADAADAMVSEGVSLSAGSRLGNIEDLERAEAMELGLRAIIGTKQAFISGSGITPDGLDAIAERAVEMARLAPDDPFCGLADKDLLTGDFPDLDICDPNEPDMEQLQKLAEATEAHAREVEGITNSEGAGAGWSHGKTGLVTSHGFSGSYAATSWSLSCAVLGGAGDAMERDYASHSARHFADLDTPEEVGLRAAERTLERLNPRKIESTKVPVLFNPRVSSSLLGHFSGAVSGSSVARGTSFLKDMMDQQVFAKGIRIVDDPLRKRGLRSVSFDGEGVGAQALTLVEDGILKSWVLETSSAKQLGMKSNGRAARGMGGPPHPSVTNLHIEAGDLTPEALMRQIGTGLLVTELIGMGVNGVTGDYSRGAAGMWIENGEPAFPVSEITIAGNLKDMFLTMTPASDLTFRRGINAPSLLIEEMSLAGL